MREFLTQTLATEVDRTVIERTRHVGEVDPLEETMRLARRFGETFVPQFPLLDDDRAPGFQTPDRIVAETHVRQRDALAGGSEHVILNRVAHGLNAERIAGHKHVAQSIQENDVPRPVEPFAERFEHADQIAGAVILDFLRQQVHQDFGVGLACQMEVRLRKNLFTQFQVVRELPVESETEPLRLFDMVPFERLRVTAVVLSAGGITHVPDGSRAGVSVHERVVLLMMAQVKNLGDAADLAMRVDQLFSIGVEAGQPCRQLPAVLDIEQ